MKNVLEYLETTIDKMDNPDKSAFIGEAESISFRQLHDISHSIGSFIINYYSSEAQGDTGKQNEPGTQDKASLQNPAIVRNTPIVVLMKKSPSTIAAFLGVVCSGNYYVPIDPDAPAHRKQMIFDKLNVAAKEGTGIVICDESTIDEASHIPNFKPILFGKICDSPIDEKALQNVRKMALDIDPLYVVFTSGSTGIPKGVVATHRSVIDYIEGLSEILDINENTVFGNQSPLYLDACLKEIFPTLRHGACAYLIPQSLYIFPVKLIEYINENKINTICWVASALSLIAGLGALDVAVPNSLKTIAFGSEVFPITHFNRWKEALPNAKFIHLYGPTEATGMSCFFEVGRKYDLDELIPIGSPFPNTEIILLDEDEKIPQNGEPGEICIRGTRLSLGYFSDAKKTSETFIQNPLSAYPDIIYRTGDFGRKGKDGELYFVSRKDHQIKHMGYRVELSEIEIMATGLESVGLACAVFDSDSSKIVLYIISSMDVSGRPIEANEEQRPDKPVESSKSTEVAKSSNSSKSLKSTVKAYLKENLPRYMLPHTIIELENIPRTPGGKLDRVRLLEMYKADKK